MAEIDLKRSGDLNFAFDDPNRSEVLYTVGVLGSLLPRDDFGHVAAFLSLFPVPDGLDLSGPLRVIAFEPELAPYLYASQGHSVLKDVPAGAPDGALVVELADGTRWAFGWEAKMFTRVIVADMRNTEVTYRVILKVFAETHLAHGPVFVYLVPRGLAVWLRSKGFHGPFVLWEDVHSAFSAVLGADDYWLKRLQAACDVWPRVTSHWKAGPNAQGGRLGREIVRDWQRGWTRFRWMGCAGGLSGMKRLVATGLWQEQAFEVRYDTAPPTATTARNWFPIANFITALRESGVEVLDPTEP